MGFYPAYTIDKVLKMKCRLFFCFLNEGYRISAKKNAQAAVVASVPHMKPEDAKATMRNWEKAAENLAETLKPKTDYSGIDKLEQNLGS